MKLNSNMLIAVLALGIIAFLFWDSNRKRKEGAAAPKYTTPGPQQFVPAIPSPATSPGGTSASTSTATKKASSRPWYEQLGTGVKQASGTAAKKGLDAAFESISNYKWN